MTKTSKPDHEWRETLSPEAFAMCRQAASEPPFSGKYYHCHDDGV